MQIRSTDPTRSRSIEESDSAAPAHAAGVATNEPARIERAPDWDRIPTLDTGAAMQGGVDRKALKENIEKLVADVKELHTVCAPFGDHFAAGMHAAHEIEKSVELLGESTHRGWLVPIALPVAVMTLAHAIPAYAHALEGMQKEAPETVRQAKPILARILRDIDEIKATLTPKSAAAEPPIERATYVRG